jgi:TPR repeat protein
VQRPAAAPVPSEPPPILAAMLRRGEALLATGDISGARRFFERGASLGSGAAARAMAETFDPATLASRNIRGLQPEPAQALQWYRRAEELGATDLAPRITRLESAR